MLPKVEIFAGEINFQFAVCLLLELFTIISPMCTDASLPCVSEQTAKG